LAGCFVELELTHMHIVVLVLDVVVKKEKII